MIRGIPKAREIVYAQREVSHTLRLLPSLSCLHDLISEIDAMDNDPSEEERDEMVSRYKEIEASAWTGPKRTMAMNMVNRTLIDSTIVAKSWREKSENFRNGERG